MQFLSTYKEAYICSSIC